MRNRRWELIEQSDGTWALEQIEGEGEGRTSHHLSNHPTFQAGMNQLGQIARESLQAEDPNPAGRFRAFLFPEGIETSDDRYINEGALFWRDPPLPLMLQTQTDVGHFGAELAGSFTTFERRDGGVWGEGTLDDSEAGRQFVEILTARERFGISGDLGEMDVEWECTELDDEGFCTAERMTVIRGEILGGTGTPFPAFAEAYIELIEEGSSSSSGDDGEAETPAPAEEPAAEAASAAAPSLVAASIPVTPPSDWFEDPALDGPTPMTVEDSGRIYGHAALWNTCHIARGDSCLLAPHSETDYAYFRLGEVRPEGCDCENIATGVITLSTEHASIQEAHAAAFEHYANSGYAVADVSSGEDEHGIWFSGALRPTVTPEQIRELRGSVISGDWRRIGGNLELIAMLAVNTPGYPVPRAQVRLTASASGITTPQAMVAVGVQPLATLVAAAGGSRSVARERDLERRLTRLERIAEPLVPQAAAAILEEITAGASPQQ